jgi:hypothetical protein
VSPLTRFWFICVAVGFVVAVVLGVILAVTLDART